MPIATNPRQVIAWPVMNNVLGLNFPTIIGNVAKDWINSTLGSLMKECFAYPLPAVNNLMLPTIIGADSGSTVDPEFSRMVIMYIIMVEMPFHSQRQ